MNRTMRCLAAVLTSGTGMAGWSAECVAQTGSRQQGGSLTVAIEEARQSPFHADLAAAGTWETRLSPTGTGEAAEPDLQQLGPRDGSLGTPTVALTYVSAGLSHLAATYFFWTCALNEGFDSSMSKCAAASLVPMVAVPAPAVIAGADLGKALTASAAGLGGGAVAYLAAMLVSENLDNANPVVAAAASSAVHAAIVNRLLR